MAVYDDPDWRNGMAGKWKEMISKYRPELCKAIDTDEFVDHLESLKVFNNRTCQTFKSTSGRYSKMSAILTALLKRPFEDFVKFCKALEKSSQKHIIDQFFTLKQETSALSPPAPPPPPPPPPPLSLPQQPSNATHTDARPAEAEEVNADPLREAWKDLIRNNYPSLVNEIDPDNGLMAQIISKKIIVLWMQDTFTLKEGRSRRAAAILDHLLLKRPYEDFLQFCDSLKATNQGHIVQKYLTLDSRRRLNQSDCQCVGPYTVDLNRTVSEVLDEDRLSSLSNLDWKAIFVETRSVLVEDVETSNEFINLLFALGVFNPMSYEACVEKTDFFRMEFILDYMRRRPDEDFIKFCTALAKTNQNHIIDIFIKHKIEKQPLPISHESVPQMAGGERRANHDVIAQPEEGAPSIAAEPCDQDICPPENRMEVEELCTPRSVICHPQDGSIPIEDHHRIMPTPLQPPQLHRETPAFVMQDDDVRLEHHHEILSRPPICHPQDDSIPVEHHHQIVPNPLLPAPSHLEIQTFHENFICVDDDQGPADINHVDVKRCSEQFYEQYHNDAYAISRRIRGFCVIVNNKYVDGLRTRDGTEKDGELLAQLFKKLQFEVRQYSEITATGIKDAIEEMASDGHLRDHQCFVLFVLSHGETDCIYGSDGRTVAVSEILEPLTDARCPHLTRKPRLVFFQACRGKHHQTQTDASGPPTYRDFLIGFPTQREYLSFRNTVLGSWYINALVQVFSEKARNTSLSEMLNMVSGKISNWSTEENDNRLVGQSSTYESHLTKSFYFFPGIAG